MSPARWLHSGATSDAACEAPTVDRESKTKIMHGLKLRAQGRMRLLRRAARVVAAPDDAVETLSKGGFEECPRARRRADRISSRPVAQGRVSTGAASVASIICVDQPGRPRPLVFIAIDGSRAGITRSAVSSVISTQTTAAKAASGAGDSGRNAAEPDVTRPRRGVDEHQ